jgi:hypothetical protein
MTIDASNVLPEAAGVKNLWDSRPRLSRFPQSRTRLLPSRHSRGRLCHKASHLRRTDQLPAAEHERCGGQEDSDHAQ